MSECDGNPIFEAAVALNLYGIRVVPLDDSLERWQLGDLDITPSELWQLAVSRGLVEGDEPPYSGIMSQAPSPRGPGHVRILVHAFSPLSRPSRRPPPKSPRAPASPAASAGKSPRERCSGTKPIAWPRSSASGASCVGEHRCGKRPQA
jgi:hypothetical protein